ncbi:hypothetical protein SNOG_10752 [Parastagonospora nodorum SN15]|uniref:Uncharacterized protein n=1 Tax=Phaeosphaeria nodorum (strain SN15 / ATCC MYA-4574 / FGSC 10173) TaxID=321614 RepID=Q0UBW2_PHANO|nr:hypothetical protein SNOG_10752 [Parastagonospora nodorum SN15]EAT82146.1 hypothetical protein SNOG_10752 [Parastagonospora nodorum SN15]
MIAHSDTLGSLGTNGQPSHPVFEAASSALIANLVPKQHLRATLVANCIHDQRAFRVGQNEETKTKTHIAMNLGNSIYHEQGAAAI